MLNTPVITVSMTKGLFSFNKPFIFPKIVGNEAIFFIATSFTKKIRIMTAIAPGIREKRKRARKVNHTTSDSGCNY
jgi:hypothetical protein